MTVIKKNLKKNWSMGVCFLLVLLSLSFCLSSITFNKRILKTAVDRKKYFEETELSSFAFGSCANNIHERQDIFERILEKKPQLFLWNGDAVYVDVKIGKLPGRFKMNSIENMREIYRVRKEDTAYSKVARNIPIIGTWDDHDYGLNNAGGICCCWSLLCILF